MVSVLAVFFFVFAVVEFLVVVLVVLVLIEVLVVLIVREGEWAAEAWQSKAGQVESGGGTAEPAAEAVTRLALAEERASYAARPAESGSLRRDGTAARRGLAATARRSSRWRAAVFPASMMTALGEAAARISDSIAALRFRHRRR